MSFQSFFDSYLETALWCTPDDNDDFLDKKYSPEDIAPESIEKLMADAQKFFDVHESLWDDDGQAGHDFWLTRNGHGAGFWDGDYPEPEATKLTEASRAFGEVDLYVGDDGKVHAQ